MFKLRGTDSSLSGTVALLFSPQCFITLGKEAPANENKEDKHVYLRGFKEHFSLIHSDLVGAGLWSTKEDDVFIRKGLQRLRLPSFVDGHILSTHT